MADDARSGKRLDQRTQVAQRQRIDDRDPVVEEQLHHHQVRRIRLFGVEFGIQADPLGARDARADRRQVGRRLDDRNVHG